MGERISLPRIDGPLLEWCAICGNRDLPPDHAYCGECRVVWRAYRERRSVGSDTGSSSGWASPLRSRARPARGAAKAQALRIAAGAFLRQVK